MSFLGFFHQDKSKPVQCVDQINHQVDQGHQMAAEGETSALQLLQESMQGKACFETCLRKIYFVKNRDEALQNKISNEFASEALQYFEGPDAFQFLLELLCGLKSKVLGETEVFGQFRNFLDSEAGKEAFSHPELQRFVIESIKEARDTYIKHWGAQSYGSLIRKLAKPFDRVSLVGFGHLAQELLPWIKGKQISIFVRSPDKIDLKNWQGDMRLSVHSLQEEQMAFAPLTIIAAPVASELLLQRSQTVETFIDCRALDLKLFSLQPHLKRSFFESGAQTVVELQDLFAQLEGEHQRVLTRVPEVQMFLAHRIENFWGRLSHRPMGWDDLCY